MLKILFLCTGNSCRSQMAEGWARHLKYDQMEAYSAGIKAHGMNPYAVTVMAEAGVDIRGQYSKQVEALAAVEFDYVITVCDHAATTCPLFRGTGKLVHHPFDDPPQLARDATSEQQVLAIYRRVRDEIREFVLTLPAALEGVRHG